LDRHITRKIIELERELSAGINNCLYALTTTLLFSGSTIAVKHFGETIAP